MKTLRNLLCYVIIVACLVLYGTAQKLQAAQTTDALVSQIESNLSDLTKLFDSKLAEITTIKDSAAKKNALNDIQNNQQRIFANARAALEEKLSALLSQLSQQKEWTKSREFKNRQAAIISGFEKTIKTELSKLGK